MVLIRSGRDRSIENDLARAYRLEAVSGDPIPLLHARMQVFRIRDGRSVGQLVSALSSDGRVISAQPNFLYRHQGQESETKSSGMQYSVEKLGLPSAHKLSQGRGVVVAVINSAIDASIRI